MARWTVARGSRSFMSTLEIVAAMSQSVAPFVPCPREYRGNFCGIYVDGLQPMPGVPNPALVLSWFYDRYNAIDRAKIRAGWKARGDIDVQISWPDSRVSGHTPEQFGATCRELIADGFRPCVFLYSKDCDPPDVPTIVASMTQVLPYLKGVVGRICVGWELSIMLSAVQVQELIDFLAPQVTGWGGRLYVHFQVGYASFQTHGSFADFWNPNVGKLTGVLYQGDVTWPLDVLQYRLADVLVRFAGQFFCSPDSGFGHPFDCIAFELQAENAFNNSTPESVQNAYGQAALNTPAEHGPLGPVVVMGAGNGFVAGT